MLPAALVYGGFTVWPGLNTIYLSLLRWDGVGQPVWAGLGNYVRVFADPQIWPSLVHSMVLIVFFTVIPTVLGLLLVALLNTGFRRGMTFFRVVYFLPQVLPLVAVGITWRWLYSEDGLVNAAIRAVGLGGIARAWLGDYYFALVALGLIGSWVMTGLCMMLFLAGAQNIDRSLYDAVDVDGGGAFRRFFSVTLPGLRGEIVIASVITTVAALASFDLVYVTTNGGPVNQTTVPGLLIYRLAFNQGQIGTASALAVLLTIMVIGFVTAIRSAMRERP